MSSLIQDQVQVLMLAEASDDYVFKPIVSPIAPEKKSKPSRALICILGTIIGFCDKYYVVLIPFIILENNKNHLNNNRKITVVGSGYVGMSLSVLLSVKMM